MTSYDRGAVVLIPFPFSDQSTVKIRPAVVVSSPSASEDIFVMGLSSSSAALLPGEFALQFWREAGLIHPTFAKRAVTCISTTLVRKELGRLHLADLASVAVALRVWFGLSE
jgi:mRNA interferase MazF